MHHQRLTTSLPWAMVALLGATCVFLFATRNNPSQPDPTTTAGAPSSAPTAITRHPAGTGSHPDDPTVETPDFDTVLTQPAGRARRPALVAAVRELAEADPAAALVRIEEELEGQDLATATRVALMVWITKDPVAAGDWVLAMSSDPIFESTLAAFASDWARIDPAAASKWVSQLPPNEANESAADALAARWSKTDALAAYNWSLEHYAQTEVGIAFQRALGALAKGDPAVAVDALGRAPSDLQYRGHTQLAAVWAKADTDTAIEWASDLPDGRNKGAALSSVLDAWSREAPGEAADYLVSLGDFPGQAHAAALVIGNWAGSDAVNASKWLATLPQGGLRDEAITGFTYTLGYTDPASALAWGMDIGEPQLREARVEEMLADWHDRDPAQARAWMEKNPTLPETIKSHVLQL